MPGKDKTKVYVVFFGIPEERADGAVKLLEDRCPDIELVGRSHVDYGGKDALDYIIQIDPDAFAHDESSNSVLKEIEDSRNDLAGLILFFGSFCDKRFFLTGLPTILVDVDPFPSLQIGFKYAVAESTRLRTRFLTASCSDYDLSESAGSARIRDFADKVRLFSVLEGMRKTRILDVQVRGGGAEPHEHWWRIDQELYLSRLKEYLGPEVVIRDYREFFDEWGVVQEQEAKALAAKWIGGESPTRAMKNKRNIGGVSEQDVTDGARVYLAADALVRKVGANAITVDSMTWARIGAREGKSYPSMSPGIAELQLHGIPSVCESDMEGMVTAVMGHHLTGGFGLMGDLIIDPFNDAVILCHCSAPINPYGDDFRAPYSVGREAARWPQFYVDLPREGPVTVMKVNVLKKQIAVFTGEAIAGESVWKHYESYSCCSKVSVRTNATAVYRNFDYRTFGNHLLLFYGDHRSRVLDLAAMLGFDVVEEDKP